MWIDDLLERNREFVQGRAARPLPSAEAVPLAVVACYDPRLDSLLRPALGLAEGDGFMLRTAGAVLTPGSDSLRSLALAVYLFEVEQVVIVGHTSCRMASFPTDDFIAAFRRRGVERTAFGSDDLRRWAGAIATPREGVLTSATAIADAPFLPNDLAVAGLVLDDASGRLEVVLKPGDPPLGATQPGRVPETGPTAKDGRSETGTGPANEPWVPLVESSAAPPVPPAGPSGAPEALHPVLGALPVFFEQLAAAGEGDDLRRLQAELAAEGHPLRKLALLQRFVQKTAAGSPEISEAFTMLKRQLRGASHDLAAKTLSDLFGPLLGRKKP